MARAGLGEGWTCRFANDLDAKKAASYQANWGVGGELKIGDVAGVCTDDLPGRADLIWASFPCQDLSLAGDGAGLAGARSGAFFPFWRLVQGLIAEGRGPKLIAIENVPGTLTSHGGRDFAVICQALAGAGYRNSALVIDAQMFVPQSRPRVFIIGVRGDVAIGPCLLSPQPMAPFHPPALQRAVSGNTAGPCLWWHLPVPARRTATFADVIETESRGVAWHSQGQTADLLALMSPLNLAKVETAKACGRPKVGTVYRRTRRDPFGHRLQRAEVRFDDIAGCLRTPAGGSSRQVILVVDGQNVRSRLISARETARLMGLSDDYVLPTRYSDAYHLTGDGVVVPVVRHLAQHIFEPREKPVRPIHAVLGDVGGFRLQHQLRNVDVRRALDLAHLAMHAQIGDGADFLGAELHAVGSALQKIAQ